MATLTGVFNFTTGGVTCATQNVAKSIWLGKPSIISQTLNGGSYFPGSQICPGNHWVGVSWNGLVGSTFWNVTPGISYYSNNTTCNFTLPNNGYSSVAITVNATNSCGTSSNTSFYLSKKTYGCGSFLVSASPNPASNDLNIKTSLVSETEGIQYEAIADAVYLVDESNSKVISIVPSDASFNLDTRQIKNGIYFLHTRFGKDEFVKRIIIKN
ncbi:MAG: T9SS type A sorting domain-containing protein [Cyclobacteriaceae bacterium]|nr:T9SS type A sorting domain-containing protein [Cyclobacteriaceae bacterium]